MADDRWPLAEGKASVAGLSNSLIDQPHLTTKIKRNHREKLQ
jgi:hypothetical protein